MRSRQLQSAAPAVLPNNADELELGATVGSRAGAGIYLYRVEAIHWQCEGHTSSSDGLCVIILHSVDRRAPARIICAIQCQPYSGLKTVNDMPLHRVDWCLG